MDTLIKGIPDWHQTINDNFTNLDTRVNENQLKIGDLTTLTTTNKTSIVNSIIELDADLLEKTNQVDFENFSDFSWFTAPNEPPATIARPNYFCNYWTLNADELIDNLYEPLRTNFSNYISRISLGKDSSGIYDFYRYEFTPPTYEKTIILGSGIHGGEAGGVLGLYRFLYNLCNNYHSYQQLAYIRWNVRIIVLPCENPWGFSQVDRGVRYNYNHVDLNRNFDYNWSAFSNSVDEPAETWGSKGTAPFSEIEAQYIRDTLYEFNEAFAYIDFHSGGGTINEHQVIFPTNSSNEDLFKAIAYKYAKKGRTMTTPTSDNPSAFVWANKIFGMQTANPEWYQNSFSTYGGTYEESEITEMLTFIGNIIIAHCMNNPCENKKTLINGFYAWDGIASKISISPSDYFTITESMLTLKIPHKGILKVTGHVCFSNTDDTATNYFLPAIGQDVNDLGVLQTTILDIGKREVYNVGMKSSTLHFEHFIPVSKSQDLIQSTYAQVFLQAKTSVGTLSITRIAFFVELLPDTNYVFYKAVKGSNMSRVIS